MRWMVAAAAIVLAGCAHERTFTDLGDGTAVPAKSVDAYAREHGVTRDEARRAMLAEHQADRAPQATSSDPHVSHAVHAPDVLLANRYQFTFQTGSMQYFMADTATGQVWRLSRRGDGWEPLPPLPAGE